MLKKLKIQNFLSFKDLVEIDFTSNNYWSKKNNVVNIWKWNNKNTLIKSLIIYWANASWKTNIIRALLFIRWFVTQGNSIILAPFLLDLESRKEPTFFEIEFLIWDKEYSYIIEILRSFDNKESIIKKEILKEKNNILFKRTNEKVTFWWDFEEFKWLFNYEIDSMTSIMFLLNKFKAKINWKSILDFFYKLWVIWWQISLDDLEHTINLLDLKNNEENKKLIIELLRCADIDICDINIKEVPSEIIWVDLNKRNFNLSNWIWYDIKFWHKINWKKIEYFPLAIESQWTQKLFWIFWIIISTIINEWILIFDEIENNLHPHIIKNIIKLINSDLNKKFQFIFTTHNLELMDLNLFKKEQIWIIEKDSNKNSKFYTLYDFDNIRSENDIKKMYNFWELWWVPYLKNFKNIIENITWVKE